MPEISSPCPVGAVAAPARMHDPAKIVLGPGNRGRAGRRRGGAADVAGGVRAGGLGPNGACG